MMQGIITFPVLDRKSQLVLLLLQMYDIMGDRIAQQYGTKNKIPTI